MKWGNGLYSWELENICVKEEGQGNILTSVFLLYLFTCFIWCIRCRWQCPVDERGAEETLSCHSWFRLALVDLAQSTKHSQKGKTPHSSCGRGVSEKRVRQQGERSRWRRGSRCQRRFIPLQFVEFALEQIPTLKTMERIDIFWRKLQSVESPCLYPMGMTHDGLG